MHCNVKGLVNLNKLQHNFSMQISTHRIKVFFAASELKIVERLKLAIKNSHHAVLVDKNADADMVVQVAGFNLPSWSESLNLTGRLHEHLDLALTKRAKFVLVLPDRADDFIRVSISLVEQFGHLFRLNYEILLIDPQLTGEELAQKLLEKIFHGYISLASEVPEQIVALKKEKPNYLWKKILLVILGFIITTWVIFVASFAITLYTLSPVAAAITAAASVVTPGSGYVAARWVIPVNSLVSLSTRASKISQLSNGLLLKLTTSQGLIDLSTHGDDLAELLENTNFQLVNLQSTETDTTWVATWKDRQTTKITDLRQLVVKINNIAGDLPEILGVTKPKKYAIILQDNTEIRATGGFIQGFALVTVQNATVTDIQYFDAAQTDQLLRGQVNAPADLTLALGQKNWYLRDGNWDPDFTNSAQRIAWFIDKELGGSPDVVVALNWQTLAAALDSVGPVDLADFGGKITASNWLDKYQLYAKADPGSTNMMVEVLKALWTKKAQAKPAQLTQLVSFILQQLDLHQILVAPVTFTTPGLALVDWQGEMPIPICRSQHPCQSLQIQAVDSNVGLNRVNPYIVRSHTMVAQISANKTSYEYTLNYQNNSPKPGWPTGDYKNFLRVYLPKGVVVEEGDYQVGVQGNFVVVSKLLTVPNQRTAEVMIKFAQPVPDPDKFHLQLDVLNQSGMRPEKLNITFNYPKVWLASSQKQFTVAGAGVLKYNTEISSPYKLDVDFVKWKNIP